MCVVDMAPSWKFDAAQHNEWTHRMQEVVQELLSVMTSYDMGMRATFWEHLLAQHCVAGAHVSHPHPPEEVLGSRHQECIELREREGL